MKLQDLREHPFVVRLEQSTPGQIARTILAANLRDRALSIAGQAFIALVPLLIVLATMVSATDGQAVASWLIDRFDLTGSSEEAMRALFDSPPDATGGINVIGLAVLLVSVNSFARGVQRTFEVAWDLPPRGHRRFILRVSGTLILLAVVGGLAVLGGSLRALPGGLAISALIQFCGAVPGWWLLSYVLLSRRVAWRALFPGALVGALGQVTTVLVGTIYVPALIERNTERYGLIGVAVALITWLVVLSFLIVLSAVLGAEIGVRLVPESVRVAATRVPTTTASVSDRASASRDGTGGKT